MSRTLWKVAYEKLKTEEPFLIQDLEVLVGDVDGQANGDIADQVAAGIARRIEAMKSRQWTYKWKGRPKKFRDHFRHVLEILITLKELPAAAGNIDPVHIGIPVAGISIILKLLSNEPVQYSAALDGAEAVATIINRYAVMEHSMFTGTSGASSTTLQSEFITVYVEVLKYEAKILRYLCRNTVSRATRNCLKFDGWVEALAKVTQADTACQILVKAETTLHQSLSLKRTENALADLKANLEETMKKSDTVEREIGECLQLISDVSIQNQHNSIRSRLGTKYESSGKWLFNDPAYLNWKHSSSGVFWLQGAIGTGKSCVTSLVVERFLEEDNIQPAFYYCSKGHGRDSSMHIIRSLLAQIVSIPDLIKDHLEEDITIRDCLTRKIFNDRNCLKFLPWAVENSSNVVFILDGLDEVSDKLELLDFLKDICSKSPIRVFITSRSDPVVKDYFPDIPGLTISAEKTSSDIETFIRGELERPERRRRSAISSELAQRLATALSERASAMFRWVELQVEVFLSRTKPLRHPQDIIRRLEQLESNSGLPDLNSVYDQVYESNTSPGFYERKLAEKALSWLIATRWPLQLTELVDIVALGYDGTIDKHITPGLLLDICSNFMAEDDCGYVHFVHLSARDYLQQRLSSESLEYSDEIVHSQAATICLSIFKYGVQGKMTNTVNTLRPVPTSEIPKITTPDEYVPITTSIATLGRLLAYASEFWHLHCSKAGKLRHRHPLKKLFVGFMTSKSERGIYKWLKSLDSQEHEISKDYCSKPLTPLFVACVWNFPEVYGALLESKNQSIAQVEEQGQRTETLADANRQKIPLCQFKNIAGTSAFVLSARHGNLSLMKAMMQLEGVTCCLSATSEWENTALHEAARSGSVAVTDFLLNFGPDVNDQNAGGDTALHLASERGHCAVIHLLIAHGADLLTRNYFGHTPLDLAKHHGHHKVAAVLQQAQSYSSLSLRFQSVQGRAIRAAGS